MRDQGHKISQSRCGDPSAELGLAAHTEERSRESGSLDCGELGHVSLQGLKRLGSVFLQRNELRLKVAR